VGKPVISAIGHEQDSPLLDLVADLRASTPTHAAALVVPDLEEENGIVIELRDRSQRAVINHVQDQFTLIEAFRSHRALADPGSLIDDARTRVNELELRSTRTLTHLVQSASETTGHLTSRLHTLSPS